MASALTVILVQHYFYEEAAVPKMQLFFVRFQIEAWNALRLLKNSDDGQDLVEYALVIAVVCLGIISGMNTLASGINTAMSTLATNLNAAVA